MTTTRRGFLAAILAAGAAPAIVQAGSIMRIAPPKIWTGVDLAKNAEDAYVMRIWRLAHAYAEAFSKVPPIINGPAVKAQWFDCGERFRVLRPSGQVDTWDRSGRFIESLPPSVWSSKLSLQMLQDEAHSRHFAGTWIRESPPQPGGGAQRPVAPAKGLT